MSFNITDDHKEYIEEVIYRLQMLVAGKDEETDTVLTREETIRIFCGTMYIINAIWTNLVKFDDRTYMPGEEQLRESDMRIRISHLHKKVKRAISQAYSMYIPK